MMIRCVGVAVAVAAGVALGFVVGCVMLFAVMTNHKHRYILPTHISL